MGVKARKKKERQKAWKDLEEGKTAIASDVTKAIKTAISRRPTEESKRKIAVVFGISREIKFTNKLSPGLRKFYFMWIKRWACLFKTHMWDVKSTGKSEARKMTCLRCFRFMELSIFEENKLKFDTGNNWRNRMKWRRIQRW